VKLLVSKFTLIAAVGYFLADAGEIKHFDIVATFTLAFSWYAWVLNCPRTSCFFELNQ